eukprot:TCALIF_06800-PA protein Name:"Similar to B52 Serine-arginine protein 55 (Drosophila melanogaster)" AED:0.12 eAED:0.13 QI:398/0.83/0.85/1/0.66/0.57/7/226/377
MRSRPVQNRSFRVYIGGLPRRAKMEDVKAFFHKYRRRFDVLLKTGFGFLEFDDYRDADDAVFELNGQKLLGENSSLGSRLSMPEVPDEIVVMAGAEAVMVGAMAVDGLIGWRSMAHPPGPTTGSSSRICLLGCLGRISKISCDELERFVMPMPTMIVEMKESLSSRVVETWKEPWISSKAMISMDENSTSSKKKGTRALDRAPDPDPVLVPELQDPNPDPILGPARVPGIKTLETRNQRLGTVPDRLMLRIRTIRSRRPDPVPDPGPNLGIDLAPALWKSPNEDCLDPDPDLDPDLARWTRKTEKRNPSLARLPDHRLMTIKRGVPTPGLEVPNGDLGPEVLAINLQGMIANVLPRLMPEWKTLTPKKQGLPKTAKT